MEEGTRQLVIDANSDFEKWSEFLNLAVGMTSLQIAVGCYYSIGVKSPWLPLAATGILLLAIVIGRRRLERRLLSRLSASLGKPHHDLKSVLLEYGLSPKKATTKYLVFLLSWGMLCWVTYEGFGSASGPGPTASASVARPASSPVH